MSPIPNIQIINDTGRNATLFLHKLFISLVHLQHVFI